MKIEEAIVYLLASSWHGMKVLGGVDVARGLFLDFQKNLYINNIASL